jgi:hypothetical protein
VLTIYKRHLSSCPHRSRTYKKCACPAWAQGTLRGESVRKSLDVRSWEAAQKIVRDLEAGVKKDVPTIRGSGETLGR